MNTKKTILIQTFDLPWQEVVVTAREKRFTTYFFDETGKEDKAHCVNTGSMRGCLLPPQPGIVTRAKNPNRKLKWTLEMLKVKQVWTCVNTHRTNALFAATWEMGLIPEIPTEGILQREVTYSGSRFDFHLKEESGQEHFIEIKQVSLVENNIARFPDAVSTRGQKHLRHLMDAVEDGYGAWMVYLIKRSDCSLFHPAADIDPTYASLFATARAAGVNVLALAYHVEPPDIFLLSSLPVQNLAENS